jgi:hypothetical protein
VIAESKKACCRPFIVSTMLMPAASVTPIEIGTSMLVRPAMSACTAERKKGSPAKAIAGSAISAETQCSRSRVAGPIEPAWPDHTATDSSITLAAAKPATPMARSTSRSWRACASSSAAASKGAARKPRAASLDTRACASSGAPSQASDSRRVEKLTRAWRTDGSRASADSTSQTQAPQTSPSTCSWSRQRPRSA